MQNMVEYTLKEKYHGGYHKRLIERWSRTLGVIENNYGTMSDIEKHNLAVLLENTETLLKESERRQSLSEIVQVTDVGYYRRHALDIVASLVPNLVAPEVVSVQALDQKIGQVFYLKTIYGSTKSGTTAGDEAVTPSKIDVNTKYSSESAGPEVIYSISESEATEVTAEGNLIWGPVIPGSVVFVLDGIDYSDDGSGNIVIPDTVSENVAITEGTIDYSTGAYSLTITVTDTESTYEVEAHYNYSQDYAPTKVPVLDIKIEEKVLIAHPRRLRTNYAFASSYDVFKQYGMDLDEELMAAALNEIKHEIDQEILGDLYRQAGQEYEWNASPPVGVSLNQHADAFVSIGLNTAANKIRSATRRVKGNFVVAGINVLNLIEGSSMFTPESKNAAVDKSGAYVAGTLNSGMKVIANPFYGDDQFIVGYKGSSFYDSGYVYAPYLPVVSTDFVMLDDFVGRRGYATSYAKSMLIPNFYVRCSFTYSSKPYRIFNTDDEPLYVTYSSTSTTL